MVRKLLFSMLMMLFVNLNAQNVLIIYDDSPTNVHTVSLKDALEGYGLSVTISSVPETQWDNTNPSLDGFNAVVHLNGTTYATEMPTAGQQALKNFVETQSGLYVGFEWSGYEVASGRMQDMIDLIIMNGGGSGNVQPNSVDVISGQEAHPVLEGVSFPFTVTSIMQTAGIRQYQTGEQSVALLKVGATNAVAMRDFGNGHVLGFNFAPNFSSNSDVVAVAEVQKIIANFVLNYYEDNDGGSSGSFAQNVLIIQDELNNANTLSLKASLETLGMSVTLSDVTEINWNNTNPSLDGFDAVIHLNGKTYNSQMHSDGQQALMDFVENQNGLYVEFELNGYEVNSNRMTSMLDLVITKYANWLSSTSVQIIPSKESHPLASGVSSSFPLGGYYNDGGMRNYDTGDQPEAIFSDANGNATVAVRPFGNGYVLGLNFIPNYDATANVLSNADIQRIIANFIINYYQESEDVTLDENYFDLSKEFRIYPNPSSDYIKVSGFEGSRSFNVFDLSGVMVKQGIISANDKIDISNFSKGIYILKADNLGVHKFVKQ